MENYVITFSAGVAAGIVLEKVLSKMRTSTVMKRTEALRACFGEPMCATTFTFSEAKEWIKAREETLSNGAKAIIVRADSNRFKSLLGEDMRFDCVDNYLVIVIVNAERSIQDSVLIKYERIDQALEAVLEKGDGALVVEASSC